MRCRVKAWIVRLKEERRFPCLASRVSPPPCVFDPFQPPALMDGDGKRVIFLTRRSSEHIVKVPGKNLALVSGLISLMAAYSFV